MTGKCTVLACNAPEWARGRCQVHYHRWRRSSAFVPKHSAHAVPVGNPCTHTNCTKKIKARGLCNQHYQRWLAAEKSAKNEKPPSEGVIYSAVYNPADEGAQHGG